MADDGDYYPDGEAPVAAGALSDQEESEEINRDADDGYEEVEGPEDDKETEDESPEVAILFKYSDSPAWSVQMLITSVLQGSASPDRAAVARAERERLKQQELHKRQLLERMREEDNALVQQGEVGLVCSWPQTPERGFAVVSLG
jgi:hypothetical protein